MAYSQRKTAILDFDVPRPADLDSLDFLGHARLGDVDFVYAKTPSSPLLEGRASTQFEMSTLFLESGLSVLEYNTDGQGVAFKTGDNSAVVSKAICYPLLCNLSAATAANRTSASPLIPTQLHVCLPASGIALEKAGKFGCPMPWFTADNQFLVLKKNSPLSLMSKAEEVVENGRSRYATSWATYEHPYFIAMLMPAQSLCYYVVDGEQAALKALTHWHQQLATFQPGDNVYGRAEAPFFFDDDLQMWLSRDVAELVSAGK